MNYVLIEPETKAFRDAVFVRKGDWIAYFAIRGYGKIQYTTEDLDQYRNFN